MTLNEFIEILNVKTNLNGDKKINKIKIDSRKIRKGDIFIAIKGNNYDGHDYVNEAIKKGAIVCIVEKDINNIKCIKVENTYNTLYDIGTYYRKKYDIPLIAITGSNGKTTTKELIAHILKSKYKVLYNVGSKNNIIGVSTTLMKLKEKHEIIVMELGSNHIGEISYLSKLCNPNVGIITNIGTSHIGYFKNRRNIFKEKLSIIEGIENKKIIINGDDKYLKKLKYYKCGTNYNNDLMAYNIHEYLNYITFNIYLDKAYKVRFNNPGKHFINDILLAIKVCLDYDINIKDIIKRINSFKLINKRMNIVKSRSNTIINDCYNASLESVRVGLDYIKDIDKNKVLILGDILELGKYSKSIHKKINKLVSSIGLKKVYTVGNYSKYIKGKHFNDVDELITYLKDNKIKNSYIYIKGSRRTNLDKVVNYLKK